MWKYALKVHYNLVVLLHKPVIITFSVKTREIIIQ